MKNTITTTILLVLSLTSCAINESIRNEALVPAAQRLWVGVSADINRGIDDAVEDLELLDRTGADVAVAQLGTALAAGASRLQMRTTPWLLLRGYAVRGIQARVDDGEIHELVVPSLLTRVDNFEALVFELRLASVTTPSRGRSRTMISTTDTPLGRETTFTRN
tara:strand:+ start:18 stop:509 length:492 start_codon:yes stop_codon:yes gene_type:complete